MFYHRVMKGPTPVEYDHIKAVTFTLLPAGQGIEEKNAPVLAIGFDFDDDLHLKRLFGDINLYFEDKIYEYRTHIMLRYRHIVVETEVGYLQ